MYLQQPFQTVSRSWLQSKRSNHIVNNVLLSPKTRKPDAGISSGPGLRFLQRVVERLGQTGGDARPPNLVSAWRRVGCAGWRPWICTASVTGKPWKKRRHFKRHLITG